MWHSARCYSSAVTSRRRFIHSVAALAAASCTRRPTAPAATTGSPTLVIRNATILAPGIPAAATAIAIADGTIVALGDERDATAWTSAGTRVVDLAGATVTAGLVDAHAHLVGLGRSLAIVDLRGAATIEEVIARLRKGAPPEGWVLGRGWDQNLWPGQQMPDHTPLTAAFPDRPVWLRRVDGHAGWGNQALLTAAGIDRDTTSTAGGEILHDAKGLPTGVLVDAAMDRVPVPPVERGEIEASILRAQQHALARGLVGIHDMGIDATEDALYRELEADGRLLMRINGYATESWLRGDLRTRQPEAPSPTRRYAMGGVKLYADGALGSRGAALLEDYADRHGHRGLLQQSPEALTELVHIAAEAGWQPAIHAIGDAANRAALDAIEHGMTAEQRTKLRPRIEHCQILAPQDIERFAKLGVIASMQPTHATSDMPWVPDRLGAQRTTGAYAWRSLLTAGASLCFGSDFPVEQVEPTLGLYSAVTRQDLAGLPAGGWMPEQRVGLDEAIAGFTSGAAFAGHRETSCGKLEIGARADLTCFGRKLDVGEPRAIADAPIAATIVDGLVAFEA